MSLKGIVRELREMKEGIGSLSRRGGESRLWRGRTRSHIAPDQALASEEVEQGQWANLPPELLLDIIHRVEASETVWPARSVVVSCAAVCKSWREVTKEIVQTPEQCGRLTFPISLKQPGPRDNYIQCFIKRDRLTSTFRLFYGLTPSEDETDKLLLAARKIRRAISTDFVISLAGDDFSRASNACVGKLRSKFLGTNFTIYDTQPPSEAAPKINFRGRVTVVTVENFQLVLGIEPHQNIPASEQGRTILIFGKIGKDIFTMDYCYPLSAFQAFAICLSNFDI